MTFLLSFVGYLIYLIFSETEESAKVVKRVKYRNLNFKKFPPSLHSLIQESTYNLDITTISLVVQNALNRNQKKTTESKETEVIKN